MEQARELYVKDLPADMSTEFLKEFFSTVGTVERVDVWKCRRGRARALVMFKTHRDAELAMKELNYTKLDGTPMRLLWADPETTRIRHSRKGALLVKNLEPSIEASQLHDALGNFGEIISCKLWREPDGSSTGRVQFRREGDAKQAMNDLSEATINGRPARIEWCKVRLSDESCTNVNRGWRLRAVDADDVTVTDQIRHRNEMCEMVTGIPKEGTHLQSLYSEVSVEKLEIDERSDKTARRFNKFVHVISTLQHPAILTFIASNPLEQMIVWAPWKASLCDVLGMESVGSNFEVERASAKWDITKKVTCTIGLAAALAYTHTQHVVHRNVRPESIYLDDHLWPLLSGFEQARFLEPDEKKVRTLGAPLYMAPEVMAGESYDYSADVYSFAMTVYHIVTGEPPFVGETRGSPSRIMRMLMGGERPMIPPDVNPWFSELITACWCQMPEERPSMTVVLNDMCRTRSIQMVVADGADEDEIANYCNRLGVR